MKMILIKIGGKDTLMSLEAAKLISNDLANKGVIPDIVDAHYNAYDTEITSLKIHLNDMRKLVGATHGITL